MVKKNVPLLFFTCLLAVLVLSSCEESSKHPGDKPYIVATTGMVADMLRNIVKDSATVVAIMHPGVDPHLYKASQGDLKKILDADYIFYNGLHLEGRLSRILEKQALVKPVISIGDSLQTGIIRYGEDAYDPHIWFDVSLWKSATSIAASTLAGLDRLRGGYYLENAREYMAQLDMLDDWVREQLNTIPKERRVLITAHDAFSYFGKAYAVEVKGLQGISTLSEFGLRDVTDLVNFITARRIPAVFVESSVSDRALKAVLTGVRENGSALRIGGNLYSDAMGEENTPEGTYIGMVQHNVKTIVEALR